MIEVYTDGLAEPTNPGIGTYGFVIYRDGRKIDEGYDLVGNNVTNNYAEYEGLIRALMRLLSHAGEEVVVKSDSRLLVNQMTGKWTIKKGQYVEKYAEARKLAEKFGSLKFEWIPREKNVEADTLSRLAYATRSGLH